MLLWEDQKNPWKKMKRVQLDNYFSVFQEEEVLFEWHFVAHASENPKKLENPRFRIT